MHWNVIAPFIDNVEDRNSAWLTPYVPNKEYQFTCIRRTDREVNWHDRSSPVTGYKEWLNLYKQSYTAVRTIEDGIVTVLPQLAALVGMQKTILGRRFPVVAWWFNTKFYSGYKQTIARAALQSINRFVVHNTAEREAYSRWLGLPIERFEFVPFQVPTYPLTESEDVETPFILSVGSAYRDYPLLFEAVKKLGFRTVVVSGQRFLDGLDIPPWVETPFGLKKPDIISLLQKARLVVLPMVEDGLVAGTVAIAETLSMGCPMIISNRQGVEDYVRDEQTGLLVKPRCLEALTVAIDRLWHDETLRDRLRFQSRQYAMQHLTDAAAGANLGRILSQVTEEFMASNPMNSAIPRTFL
jgi:glycosyltransferase involved in cell wall biosynthesis